MLRSLFNKVVKEKGLEDMADIDLNAPMPEGWEPETEDPDTDFDAKDRNVDANG